MSCPSPLCCLICWFVTIIPFGSLVEYHPISAKDLPRLHQFGPKVLPGFCLENALHAGGIWIGDIEEWEEMDASEIRVPNLRVCDHTYREGRMN